MAASRSSKTLVIGDWDADGVIAAAEVVYSQEILGVFPDRCKCGVEAVPASPRTLAPVLEKLKDSCWDNVVILDIPYTDEVAKALADFVQQQRSKGCQAKVYYFDHHNVTIERSHEIEAGLQGLPFVGVSSTSVLVRAFLESQGAKLSQRLKELVMAAAVLEGGGGLTKALKQKGPTVPEGVIKMVASISKALNQTKDPEMWKRYVRWAASILPFEIAVGEASNPLSQGLSISEESDREVKQAAIELAMSAKNVGPIKLVDARGKWNKSGSSALASAIYKMTRTTTALLVTKSDGATLLIIRSGRGEAMKLAEELYKSGLALDVGGHHNIASVRLRDGIAVSQLEDALRRAVLNMAKTSARKTPDDSGPAPSKDA